MLPCLAPLNTAPGVNKGYNFGGLNSRSCLTAPTIVSQNRPNKQYLGLNLKTGLVSTIYLGLNIKTDKISTISD